MKIESTRQLSESQKQVLLDLWNREYPVQLGYRNLKDFELYLSRLDDPHHHLLVDERGSIQGWAFDFTRDEDRWFGIIVSRDQQGKGFGKQLLTLLKQKNTTLNGWMIDHDRYLRADGSPYLSPVKFYRSQGFRIIPEDRIGLDVISVVKIEWKT